MKTPFVIIKEESGSMLIACVLISFMALAVMVQFCSWVRQSTRANVHRIATQKALINADSGIQSALQYLQKPQASELLPGQPLARTSIAEGSTFYLQLTRQVADPSLVTVSATGYYQLKEGSFEDPYGNKGQQAVISAVVQLVNVGNYFAAAPGDLRISYGSDISQGSIYGRNLIFEPGSSNPKTIVKAGSYASSINPPNFADYVTFLDPGQPDQLTSEPNLPILDASMRQTYQNMAGSDVIAVGAPPLAGLVEPPTGNTYKVFFAPGDVTLGAPGSSCTFNGSFLIYSMGDIYIDNTVNTPLGSTAWPALMAEGNIYITNTAPNNLEISATLVTNGDLKALGSPRPNGILTMTGGIIARQEITLGSIYTMKRNYKYQPPDPTLPLPFATRVIQYKVKSGKHNQ